jgi:GDPmannose 4,6-dehydratase
VTSSLKSFVEAVFDSVGLDWRDYVSSNQNLFRPSDIAVGRANPKKAKEHLGWEAKVNLQQIVQGMVMDKL